MSEIIYICVEGYGFVQIGNHTHLIQEHIIV